MNEKVKTLAAWTVVLIGGGILFWVFFRYAAGVLLPFAFGWGIAMAARRPASFLHQKTKLPLGGARLIVIFLFTALLCLLLIFGVRGLVLELSALAERVDAEGPSVLERIQSFLASLPLIGKMLAEGETVQNLISAALAALPDVVAAFARTLPSFFFSLGVGAIAAVYFCLDLDRIHAALLRLLPHTWQRVLRFAKNSATRAALSVLRAEGTLMLIAFVLMLVGFILLDLRYPLLLSALFSLFDILPVLGVGMLLVPWAIISLLMGQKTLGIGLLILFGVISVIRQFAEAHLLGASYGVHPLLTLLSLFAGARFFGVTGMLLFPVLTLLLYEIFFKDPKQQIKNKNRP